MVQKMSRHEAAVLKGLRGSDLCHQNQIPHADGVKAKAAAVRKLVKSKRGSKKKEWKRESFVEDAFDTTQKARRAILLSDMASQT